MPMTCAVFLDKVKTKKTVFALLGKSTQWKVYVDSEIVPLLKSDKVKEDMQLYTGKAEWKSNKLDVLVDGDKEDAKKAFKAAYTAEKIKWEDAGFAIKDGKDDQQSIPGQAAPGQANGAAVQQPTTGAPAAQPLDKLQMHKIKVLNPKGPQAGVYKVPLALTEAQVTALLANLPPGTKASRVDAGAITLETPIPAASGSAAPSQQQARAAAQPLTALQAHKIKVLNPNGPQAGVYKVPLALTEAQVTALLANLPPGTKASRVDAGAITLDTPVPSTASPAAATPGPAGHQQGPTRPKAATPETPPKKPPQRPFAAAPTELERIKERLAAIGPEIKALQTIDPALAKKATDALELARTDLGGARVVLDEVEEQIAQLAQKAPVLRLATQLRMDWTALSRENDVTDPDLIQGRQKVLDALASNNAKDAVKALLKLQEVAKPVREQQLLRKKVFAGNNSIKGFEAYGLQKKAAFAKEMKMSEETFEKRIGIANKNLIADAKALRPQGFAPGCALPDLCTINPLVPKEARPKLSRDEATALLQYSLCQGPPKDGKSAADCAPFKLMNNALREGKKPSPPEDKTYDDLQKAFGKTKPFPEPVPVVRGMNFSDKAALDKFLQPFRDALGKDILVPLNGFISTGSSGIQPNFAGNVMLTIMAKRGLDLLPYTEAPQERELLLNHGTMLMVHEIKQQGDKFEVNVEQILPRILPK